MAIEQAREKESEREREREREAHRHGEARQKQRNQQERVAKQSETQSQHSMCSPSAHSGENSVATALRWHVHLLAHVVCVSDHLQHLPANTERESVSVCA